MRSIKNFRNLIRATTFDKMDSPIGVLTIITSIQGLHAILWDIDFVDPECGTILKKMLRSDIDPTIVKTKNQLTEYFQGKRQIFDLPLVMDGTEFQIKTWYQLLKIPYGETISYGEQAKRMGDHKKARAVGMCNGLNPISIVVPCHRVIGANGKLTGFAGGLNKKKHLLKLESTAKH